MARRRWTEVLHRLRRKEIEIIFSECPEGCFLTGLELGAGDGFQSSLLTSYVKSLVSTDYDRSRLALAGCKKVHYLICDAEQVGRTFRPGYFDLVFSSNLMEHLPRPDLAFRGVHRVLKDDGVCISVMPNPFMKLMWMIFFYPNKLLRIVEVLGEREEGIGGEGHSGDSPLILDNNPQRIQYGFLRRQVWPVPHGAYRSNFEEFVQYRRTRWVRLIEDQDFEVIGVLKMPVTTGYGFGLERVRGWLERMGFACGYGYVAVKKGCQSPLRNYWPGL
jgi:SAM-dependent methyltransferase